MSSTQWSGPLAVGRLRAVSFPVLAASLASASLTGNRLRHRSLPLITDSRRVCRSRANPVLIIGPLLGHSSIRPFPIGLLAWQLRPVRPSETLKRGPTHLVMWKVSSQVRLPQSKCSLQLFVIVPLGNRKCFRALDPELSPSVSARRVALAVLSMAMPMLVVSGVIELWVPPNL